MLSTCVAIGVGEVRWMPTLCSSSIIDQQGKQDGSIELVRSGIVLDLDPLGSGDMTVWFEPEQAAVSEFMNSKTAGPQRKSRNASKQGIRHGARTKGADNTV